MIKRAAAERGRANFGWLDSRHSFSFGHYYDPRHSGFGVLRVINDDRVTAGAGFPRHPHRDMEIVSYVVEGELAHQDTLGNGSVIRPGDVQRMSAGSGIAHSEMNPSRDRGVRFLQIWIVPAALGSAPGYEQRHFASDAATPLRLVVSPEGRDGSVSIGQDVCIFRGLFEQATPTEGVAQQLDPQRSAWVQVVRGAVTVNGEALTEGDGAALPSLQDVDGVLTFNAEAGAEVLLFDLPKVNDV